MPPTRSRGSGEAPQGPVQADAAARVAPGPERTTLPGRRTHPGCGSGRDLGQGKGYKCFSTFDLMLHVAMGWTYRDRVVRQGAVSTALLREPTATARARRRRSTLRDRRACSAVHHGGQRQPDQGSRCHGPGHRTATRRRYPRAVVLDTLNKSLHGSESSDETWETMSAPPRRSGTPLARRDHCAPLRL